MSHHAVTLGGLPQRRNRIDRKRLVTVNEDIVLKEPDKTYPWARPLWADATGRAAAIIPRQTRCSCHCTTLCFDTVPRADRDSANAIRLQVRPLGTRQSAVNAISAETGKTLWSARRAARHA
jgi:hypothetical protein